MRIAIGVILTNGYAPPHTFYWGRDTAETPEGLVALLQRIQSGAINAVLPADQQIHGVRVIKSAKFPTDVARNEICRGVLTGDEEYLLFLDADMIHPADLLDKLLAADKDVITARYHVKKAPFAAVAYVKHRTKPGSHRYASVHFGRGVFEIERGGGGALLIHRDVLQAIHDDQLAKWQAFLASDEYRALPAWTKDYLPELPIIQWFRYQQEPKAPFDLGVSEDFWFWQQARETGFKGFCDWDIDVPHVGEMNIDGTYRDPFLNQQVGAYTNPAHRQMVLDNTIVCGFRDGLFLGAQGDPDAINIPAYQVTAGER
jgi:hypothetical protein